MKKIFLFLILLNLSLPTFGWAIFTVDHQSLKLPDCDSREKSLYANTFSFDDSALILHLVNLGECGTHVYNALSRSLIHSDPSGNFRSQSGPYFFSLSDSRLMIGSPSRVTIIDKQNGLRLFTSKGRLYEIKDYNGDGTDDFTIAYHFEDRKVADIELYLTTESGSYEFAGITEMNNGGALLRSEYFYAKNRSKSDQNSRTVRPNYDRKKLINEFRSLTFDPDTFSLRPNKPYSPDLLIAKMVDPNGNYGLTYSHKELAWTKPYEINPGASRYDKKEAIQRLNLSHQFYQTLSEKFKTCNSLYIKRQNKSVPVTDGKTVFCTPHSEVPFINRIDGYTILKNSGKSVVVARTPDKVKWLYYNSHLFEQNNPSPLHIDLRKVRGIGSGSSIKLFYGNRFYVRKHGKLNIFNTQDIVDTFRSPEPHSSETIFDPFANEAVIAEKAAKSTSALAGALPPLKNQGKLVGSQQQSGKKNTPSKATADSQQKKQEDWTRKKQPEVQKTGKTEIPAQGTVTDHHSEAQPQLSAIELRKEGTRLAKKREFSKALIFYKKALALEPTDLSTLNNTGLVLKKIGRLTEALKTYEKAAKLYPETPVLRKNIGLLYELLSIKEYKAYLELSPKAKDADKVKKRIERLQTPVK